MHRGSFALLLLFGCARSSATPPHPAPLTSPSPPKPSTLVIVEIVQRFEECSGLGGEHYVLRTLEATPRLVHAGGHGARLDLIPLGSLTHAFAVAKLELLTPSSPPVHNPGWCLGGLPRFDAHARLLVQAKDETDARRKLAILVREGVPPPGPHRQTRVISVEPCTTAVCARRP